MANVKLTEKIVGSAPPPTDVAQDYYWDEEVQGFGLVVGRTGARTFVVRARVAGGERRKVTIGHYRAERGEGKTWTVEAAREEAKRLIGQFASGKAVKAPGARRSNTSGPTLRDAMEAHVARMKKKQRAERSIATFENELQKYLADRLDRPIAEINGESLIALHDSIKAGARDRANRNTSNAKGAPLANRVIAHVGAAWNTLNRNLEGALGAWNPAKSVDRDKIKEKRERLVDLADWATRVGTMANAVQRDGLMLALYTGLRSEDVRTVRFENVDWKARTLRLPDPKGGEDAAFSIPLSPTAFEILKRRKHDNARSELFSPHGGDNGWAFPALVVGEDKASGQNAKGGVGPISDLRQQVSTASGYARFPREDVHTLRRTYLSIAQEVGVSELDQHVLSNHSFGSRNVNETYVAQSASHLAEVAAKIDAAITRQIEAGSATRSKKNKRR